MSKRLSFVVSNELILRLDVMTDAAGLPDRVATIRAALAVYEHCLTIRASGGRVMADIPDEPLTPISLVPVLRR